MMDVYRIVSIDHKTEKRQAYEVYHQQLFSAGLRWVPVEADEEFQTDMYIVDGPLKQEMLSRYIGELRENVPVIVLPQSVHLSSQYPDKIFETGGMFLQRNQSPVTLLSIFDSIGEGVVTADAKGVITYVNHSALKMLEKPRHQVVGAAFDHVFQIIHPDTGVPDSGLFQKALHSTGPMGLWRKAELITAPGSAFNTPVTFFTQP